MTALKRFYDIIMQSLKFWSPLEIVLTLRSKVRAAKEQQMCLEGFSAKYYFCRGLIYTPGKRDIIQFSYEVKFLVKRLILSRPHLCFVLIFHQCSTETSS